MNKETVFTSAFRVHRSKFSCSLAAALLAPEKQRDSTAADVGATPLDSARPSRAPSVRERSRNVNIQLSTSDNSILTFENLVVIILS